MQAFGEQRVLDTPIAEASIAGVSVGLAAQGLRPVAEIQFTGFAYACIDQIINHAARLRSRTRGRLTCPMVLRAPREAGLRRSSIIPRVRRPFSRIFRVSRL